jgi:hypothetical protein
MVLSDLELILIAFGITIGICIAAGCLSGQSRWPSVSICLVAGAGVLPSVVAFGVWIADYVEASHNTLIWFLLAWVLCISFSVVSAIVIGKR